MEKTIQRKLIWDFFKGIFAIGVVFVHFPFPWILGKILASFGTTGVIFFFLISGYQSYSADGSKADKLLVRFKRNLVILLVALLVYFSFTIIQQLVHGTFDVWIANFRDPMTYFKMIILGDFSLVNADALWYMTALLICYPIMYMIEKKRLNKYFYAVLPFLILLRIAVETYVNSFSFIDWLDWHYAGNFLVGGLPIMVLGNYLHCKEERIKKLNGKAVVTATVISALMVFLFVNVKIGSVDISQPFKISTAVLVFICCMIYSDCKGVGCINTLGRKYSMYIYIYHYLIGTTLAEIFAVLALPGFYKEIHPACPGIGCIPWIIRCYCCDK
ncbi:MAG: acyltransferase family protein [Oscillospiraceae bacterium]